MYSLLPNHQPQRVYPTVIGMLLLTTLAFAGSAFANGVPIFLLDGVDAGAMISVTMSEDGDPTAFVIDPLLTAEDSLGDTSLIVWSVSTPATNGDAMVIGMGATPTTFTYVPDENFNGSDSFEVTITDSDTLTDTITVNVTIDPVNDAPEFVGDFDFAGKWGSPGSGNGQFSGTSGIVTDSTGNVYVVDQFNSRVQKFDADGTFITQFGSSGSGDGQFGVSLGMAVDASDNIYVCDRFNNRVQKFDANGNFLLTIGGSGSGDGQFQSPIGIAVAPSGNIYVAEDFLDRIQKFDASGNFLLKWGSSGSGDGQFDSPFGVAVDASENVYVTGFAGNRVQVFDSSGSFLRKWGSAGSGDGEFSNPWGITVGSDNLVYVTDASNNRVQIFDTMGDYRGQFGSGGSGDGQFSFPSCVWQSAAGRIFVGEYSGNRVQYFEKTAVGAAVAVTMDEDGSPAAFSLPLSAADAEGDTITWSISSAASHGTADVSGTGISKAIAYVPDANYNGMDSFDVQIDDGNGVTDTLTVNVTLDPQNDVPEITQGEGPLSVTMDEDSAPTAFVAPTLGASNVDDDTLTWSVSSAATNGTATVSGDGTSPGTFTYVPDADFNGMDSFTVQVSDGNMDTDSIVVNVTVSAVNDAPVITQGDAPLAVTMSEDGTPTAFVAPTVAATDVEMDTLTWSVATAATNGTATVNGDGASPGTFTYVPNADFNGVDSFTIQVADGNTGTDTIAVNVTVTPENDAPEITQGAGPLAVSMDEDESPTAFVAPTLGATDIDGDTLTWSVSSAATNGTATVSGDGASPGTFTYTPTADFNGMDGFTIQVSDGNTGTDTITVNVTVNAQPESPTVATNTGATVTEGGTVILLSSMLEATDADSAAGELTYTLTDGPTDGMLVLVSDTETAITSFTQADINNTQVIFVHDGAENATDEFEFSVSDGTTTPATGTFAITVTPVDDAPTLFTSDDASQFTEDGGAIFVDEALMVVDPDDGEPIEGARVTISTGYVASEDTLSLTEMHGITGSFNTSDGVLSLSGSATAAQYEEVLRSVQFNSSGDPDDTQRDITFSLGDAIAYSENGHFYRFETAQGISWNDANTAASALRYFGLEGYLTTVTSQGENDFVVDKLSGQGWMGANDVGAEGTWRWVTGPEGLEDGGMGLHFYTGTGNGSAVDGAYNNWASGEPNDAGGEDYAHFLANGQWNDFPLSLGSITGYVVEFGSLPEGIELHLVDTKAIDVTLVNDAPIIDQTSPLAVTMDEDGTPTAFVAPTLTATDEENGELTWSLSSAPTFGTATVSGMGTSPTTLTYVPSEEFNGADSFVIKVTDDGDATDIILVNITVTPQNDVPTIDQGDEALSVTMDEDGAPTAFVAPTLSATDIDGDTLTWSVSTPASNGTATVSGSGATPESFSYMPTANASGADSFTVQVDDGNGGTDTIVVNVTITPQNDTPVITQGDGPLAVIMDEDGEPTAFVAPEVDATDVDGDTLTWSVSSPASNGTATVSGSGAMPDAITYVPAADFNGSDSFTIQVDDSNGGTDTIAVNVTVTSQNDTPVITQGDGPLVVTMDEDGEPTAFVAPEVDATDADDDTLSWSVSSPASNGTATVTGSGATPETFTYTPTANFNGTDSFTIQVSDGNDAVDTIAVSVTITARNDTPVITQGDGPLAVTMDEDGEPTAFVAPEVDATDVDDDTLTWSVSSPASNGTATVTGSGATPETFTYTPTANFNGTDSFTIQVSDGNDAVDTIAVSVTITARNDAPTIAVNEGTTVNEGQSVILDTTALSAADVDDDAANLVFTVTTAPNNGQLKNVNDPGTPITTFTQQDLVDNLVEYIHDGSETVTDSFAFSVADDGGDEAESASGTFNITVTPGNDVPQLAFIGNQTVAEGTTLSLMISATDADGDTLTYSVDTLPNGATFDADTATFSWTPDSDAAGSYEVTFSVTDDADSPLTDSETISILVTDVPVEGDLAESLLEVFDDADVNGDGLISRAESQALFPGLTESQFDALDTNQDGFLSEAELRGTTPPGGCTSPDGGDLFGFGLVAVFLIWWDSMMQRFGRFMGWTTGETET